MKVTITDKGEGYVIARYDAQSSIEAMMLSTCQLVESETSAELKTDATTDWGTTPPTKRRIAGLTFHGFRIPVHSVLVGK